MSSPLNKPSHVLGGGLCEVPCDAYDAVAYFYMEPGTPVVDATASNLAQELLTKKGLNCQNCLAHTAVASTAEEVPHA